MRLIFVLLIVLGSFPTGTLNASQTTVPPYIKVMSFNIRYDEPRDGENAWPNRKNLVANLIRFHHVDIIGVQEALKGQLDDLSELGYWHRRIRFGTLDTSQSKDIMDQRQHSTISRHSFPIRKLIISL